MGKTIHTISAWWGREKIQRKPKEFQAVPVRCQLQGRGKGMRGEALTKGGWGRLLGAQRWGGMLEGQEREEPEAGVGLVG